MPCDCCVRVPYQKEELLRSAKACAGAAASSPEKKSVRSDAYMRSLSDGALVNGEGRVGALDEETGALDLADVVEAYDADVRTGEELLAVVDLTEDLLGVGATEHGELEHRPVAVVLVGDGSGGEAGAVLVGDERVLGGGELDAGGEAGVGEVLNLGSDLGVGEGGEEGHGLEELVVEGVPDTHGSLGLGLGGDGGGDASNLSDLQSKKAQIKQGEVIVGGVGGRPRENRVVLPLKECVSEILA
jgi:hypothetical protein